MVDFVHKLRSVISTAVAIEAYPLPPEIRAQVRETIVEAEQALQGFNDWQRKFNSLMDKTQKDFDMIKAYFDKRSVNN